MSDDREKDFPQKFTRVIIPCIVEWTDEGPHGNEDIRRMYTTVERLTNEELVKEALGNLDIQIEQLDPSAAHVIRGEYVLSEGVVATRIILSSSGEEKTHQ